jgi:hypothetical protein
MTMRRSLCQATLLLLALQALLSCSGGGGGGGGGNPPPPPPTPVLTYTDPSSGAYRLVRNPGKSSGTHLVFDVVYAGTGSLNARGVGFYLNVDASKATWARVDAVDTDLVQKGVIDPGPTNPLLKAKVSGGELQAGIYQKGSSQAAVTLTANSALARVALDIRPGITTGAISLSAPANRAVLLPESADPTAIVLSVGTLTFQ